MQALGKLVIDEVDSDHCKQLIGIGMNGASVNIYNATFKGVVEVNKCECGVLLTVRLELKIKDALKGTYFDDIDDMLLRLYYIYKSDCQRNVGN